MKRTDKTRKAQADVWAERLKDPNYIHPSTGTHPFTDEQRVEMSRTRRGKVNGSVKITDLQIREILTRYINREFSNDDLIGKVGRNGKKITYECRFEHLICKEYDVTPHNISGIIHGQNRSRIYEEFKEQIQNLNA